MNDFSQLDDSLSEEELTTVAACISTVLDAEEQSVVRKVALHGHDPSNDEAIMDAARRAVSAV